MNRTTTVEAKSMFASKTFWFNLIVGFTLLLEEVLGLIPQVRQFYEIPEAVQGWLLVTLAFGNIVLRRITDSPARFHGSEPVEVPRYTGPPEHHT